MEIERAKNASCNIVFGLLLKLYQILVPFLMRKAMIYFMGMQYVGLNRLFTSELQVKNLAELGVGSAMVFSIYKPIQFSIKYKTEVNKDGNFKVISVLQNRLISRAIRISPRLYIISESRSSSRSYNAFRFESMDRNCKNTFICI